MTVAPPAVRLRAVHKRYGQVSAVRNVSLDVAKGEFLTLVGPSGAGKSTLLSLIAGFVEADAGEVSMGGQDLSHVPPQKRNVGVVFQDHLLFPHMTVAQNVGFPLEMRRINRKCVRTCVADALGMVELGGFDARQVTELSGGERQRVALARALVSAPPVLLLDEPLGALDRQLREAMQDELRELHARLGTTFIYVTHDQEEALSLGSTVAVMRDGVLPQVGTPREVYDTPATAFVAQFLGACNVWAGTTHAASACVQILAGPDETILYRGPDTGLAPEVLVAVRPEWLRLDPDGSEWGLSRLDVCVSRTQFRGSELLIEGASPLGQILVRVPRSRGAQQPAPGQLVVVGWHPEDAVLVHPDSYCPRVDRHDDRSDTTRSKAPQL